MKWNADPGLWFDAMRAVGKIEKVTSDGDAAVLTARLGNDPNAPAAAEHAGDAIVARRAAMPTLYPELWKLASGGPGVAEAILARFRGGVFADATGPIRRSPWR